MIDTQTVSAQIANHLATTRFDDLDDAAIEATKKSLLDALAVSLGATETEAPVRPFLNLARESWGQGNCEILGHPGVYSPEWAAFGNGALAHALDYEDAFDAAPMHPNAAVIPALLAMSQSEGSVSGKQFLTAMALGCDLACRLGLCLLTPAEAGGWYPPPMFTGFGAIAAAGKISKFEPRQYLDAFSFGLNQITCSGEIKYNPDSAIRAVRDAFPAKSAVLSARLAKSGMKGFDQPFEGKNGFFRLYANGDFSEEILLDGLGRNFKGSEISFKPWPSCRGTHAFIEAAIELRNQIPDLYEIDKLTLTGGPILEMLAYPLDMKRAPVVAIDAKFSIFYTTALALTRGHVTLNDFRPEDLSDPDILRLTAISDYVNDGSKDPKDASSGALDIQLKDSTRLQAVITEPRGSVSNPMSREDLTAKAIECTARARRPLSEAATRRLADTIWSLEAEEDAVESLFSIIRPVN
ncbi:MAG: 2-methylcitrate dehydratase [Ponticaulis sp.]|nr:2-methylcitrate dehydratase [Ponticaulis sp.]|tara:strand:+ start:1670 stop:3070 length:1401 start_codon:yes stop_codon:yes gene_type:complete